MCGRFKLESTINRLAEMFKAEIQTSNPQTSDLFKMGEQVRPTDQIPVIIEENGKRILRTMKWAFTPSWSREPQKSPLINARSETVFEKPSFKEAIRRRRAIIPATNFIEWKREGNKKTPYLIQASASSNEANSVFAMAAIWETWKTPSGEPLETVAILTTAANETMAPIHDRMPVIIKPEDLETWFSPQTNSQTVQSLFQKETHLLFKHEIDSQMSLY